MCVFVNVSVWFCLRVGESASLCMCLDSTPLTARFSCALFLLLMLATDNVYARASFAFVSRAFIFGAFATVYLWTPLVLPAHLRTSGMGLVSSFGKIASICAPFISSTFDKTSVLVPSVLYGSMALVAAVLVLLVGVEPDTAVAKQQSGTTARSDDETTALIKG